MKSLSVILLGCLLSVGLAARIGSDTHINQVIGSDNDEVKNNEQNLQGIPRLVKTPPHVSYVKPRKSVRMQCIANPATYVNIFCNDNMVLRNRLKEEITQETNGGSIRIFYVDVSFTEVNEWFGKDGEDYWCICEAWNTVPHLRIPKKVRSPKAFIKMTYLEERFQFSPMPKRIEAKPESLLQMQCTPPLGLPTPKVFWEKNGEKLEANDRITIDHQDSLIIKPVQLSDAGNYSCVAENAAGRLLSEPALLEVYKNGAWSSWTGWSEFCPEHCLSKTKCLKFCSKLRRERDRSCTDPSPENGGDTCVGQSLQSESCDATCNVDGAWSSWSAWSTCNHNCQQIRRRNCDHPLPKNKGLDCVGSHFESRNCTDVSMSCNLHFGYQTQAVPTKIIRDVHDITMYVGLFVAVAVLFTVIVVVIYLLKRKIFDFGRFTHQNIHFSNHVNGENCNLTSKNKKNIRDFLIQPDITKSAAALTNKKNDIEPVLAMSSTLVSRPAAAAAANHSLQVILPHSTTSQSNGSCDERITPYIIAASTSSGVSLTSVESKCSCNENMSGGDAVCGVKPRPCSALYHEPTVGFSRHNQLFAKFVPNNIDLKAMAWATVDEDGGRLNLPESGISLTIPPGSLAHGQSEEFFLAVCRDSNELPRLSDQQTVLSPLILCGPSLVATAKPFVISFPHSACLMQGFWSISVLSSNSLSNDYITWKEVVTLGQETINTPIFCQLDNNHCHLMTDQLQRYCLIGQSMEGGNAVKVLCLAAFATPLNPGANYIIRVYVLADTRDAFENVLNLEIQQGGILLGTKKQLLFRDGGHNLCISVEDLSPGRRHKEMYQEIPFQHVWNGNQCGKLHCIVSLEHVDLTKLNLSCKIVVYQNNFFSNRQIVEILGEKREAAQTTANIIFNAISKVAPPKPLQNQFRLPRHLRLRLCHLLDIPNSRGNDWRMLAHELGVDRYINFFAVKSSPTECILDLWEARNRDDSDLHDLAHAFRSMYRTDCASLLETQAVWNH